MSENAAPVEHDVQPDAGFTLIEMVIALVLSAIIAGVTVAAMLTSMNVIDVTTEQISGSTDTGLISSFFYRDAQAAGGTLPSTGQADPAAGVSVTNSPAGWQGCAQPGVLVVRFSWVERVSPVQDRNVVVTYALAGNHLTRRSCVGATVVDLVLGENVVTADATCHPNVSCSGTPDRVSLHVKGTGERNPADHTFSASLRELPAGVPSSTSTIAAPLVVLGGGSTPCPPLSMGGTADVTVLGDAVVAAGCGSSLVGGDASLLEPTGVTSGIVGVVDPLTALVAPAANCSTGTNPSPLGVSPSSSSIVVHPQPVVITAAVTLQPGRYVFCHGLTLGSGAVVQGTDVSLIIPSGGLQIDTGARVDVSAPTSGAFANVLVWSASSDALTMTFDPAAGVLRGLVYAPDAAVTITARSTVSVGGLVAGSVRFQGDSPVRLGMPIAHIGLVPPTLPVADVGVPYGPVTLVGSGGTAPYQFVAVGLPPGLTLSSSGQLSGTPSATGAFDVVVNITDSTGTAGTSAVQIGVVSPASISGPATLPDGLVGSAYAPTTMVASGGAAPLSWSATGLPPGLSMSAGGVLSGTPTVAGTSAVDVTLTDALGSTATTSYSLTIAGGTLAVSDPQTLYAGQEGLPYSTTTMTALGGAAPYVWSATGLPPGLTMSMSGEIAGTPTTAGTYSVVAYTSDSVGTFAVKSYTVVISPAAPAAPPTCPTSPSAWRAEYYANTTLSGAPAACRDDPSIAFAWNGAAPDLAVAGTDFSVRWSRTVNLTAGTYQFVMGSDDGARLYIDGALVMDDWVYRSYASRGITQVLGTGPHNIVMEYFQGPGQSAATLDWTPVVPAVCPATITGWLGEYFPNRTLTGPATLCRDDATIDFDWSQGTPGAPLSDDDFSVRWTRTEVFAAGTYAFQIGSDDGARLYIDGVLVGDWWYDTPYATRTLNQTLTAGAHTIVMEFYERGGFARATLAW